MEVGRHWRLLAEVSVHVFVQVRWGILLLRLALLPVRLLLRLLNDRHAAHVIAVLIDRALVSRGGGSGVV